MDDVHCFSYGQTGYFSKLILDYLDEKEELKTFYHRFPNVENFGKQMEDKRRFSQEKRQLLQQQLKIQYGKLLENENAESVNRNIDLLTDENTFTVTTGHQLNIFTGPLYFIYKIITTINLAEELKAAYPDCNFIPVYWMASEDHDFAEINHININESKVSWNTVQKGAVGRMQTEGLDQLKTTLQKLLGPGKNAQKILTQFFDIYTANINLAKATQYIVHQLFHERGLVIIDGDDKVLKTEMIPYFKIDLFDHLPKQKVSESSEELQKLYFDQVHPREINLFYLDDNVRERIERAGDKWVVLNKAIEWKEDDLRKELNTHPERFSPNVVLRPLYQEVILPNLAYIGGGGELAYWFQLKEMFNAFEVTFPILVLRNSVQIINSRQVERMEKLGLNIEQLFQPLHKIKTQLIKNGAPVDPGLSEYEKQLQQMFDELEEVANLTDRSMLGAVNAQRQKQLNGLENLKKRLIKAEKRKKSDEMERLEKLYYECFPGGGLQERHDNLLPYYSMYGEAFLEKLFQEIKPFDFRFRIIKIV